MIRLVFGRLLDHLSYKFIAFLVLLSPLLSNFNGLGAVSVGDLFVLCALLYALLFSKFSLHEYLKFLFFLIAFLLLICFSYTFGISDFGSQFRIGFYVISAVVLSVFLKREWCLVEVYILLCLCFSCLLFVQLFVYFYSGYILYYVPSGFEIEVNVLSQLDIGSQGFRSGGIFREPSYLALYIAPALVVAAWRRQFFLWCIFCAAAFLSTSVFGVFFSLISLAYVFGSSRYFVWLCLGGVLVLPPFVFLILDFLPSRVGDTLSGAGSLEERVFAPFREVFLVGDWMVPNLELINLIKTNDFWVNSMCYVFALFGVLGAGIVLLLLLNAPLCFFPLLLVILLASHALSTPFFLICYLIFCTFHSHFCSETSLQ